MKKQYLIFTLLFSFLATASLAQKRYIDPIYSDADIEVTSDVKYATNISFLLSKTSNQAQVIADLTAIKTAYIRYLLIYLLGCYYLFLYLQFEQYIHPQ